jgi:hypothetical protein
VFLTTLVLCSRLTLVTQLGKHNGPHFYEANVWLGHQKISQ